MQVQERRERGNVLLAKFLSLLSRPCGGEGIMSVEERRKDYPGIKDRLTVLETNWLSFQKSYDEWKDESKGWRMTLCGKIDRMLDKIEVLPCKEHGSWYKSLSRQVSFMWLALGGFLLTMFLIIFNIIRHA